MADPRNAVSHLGNAAHYETFLADGSTITASATAPGGSLVVGRAVTFVGGTSDDTVALAGDGAVIAGKLIAVEADLTCTVQTRGYCTLPGGTSATLSLATKIVGALLGSDPGYIQTLDETVSASPSQAEVQNAFTAAKTRGLIINTTATTAVVVDLG